VKTRQSKKADPRLAQKLTHFKLEAMLIVDSHDFKFGCHLYFSQPLTFDHHIDTRTRTCILVTTFMLLPLATDGHRVAMVTA
jgi:hypothetical protein